MRTATTTTQSQAQFEQRVRSARIRELRYKLDTVRWFSIGISIVLPEYELWWFCSHESWCFGESLEEVLAKAERNGYPKIRQLFGLFRAA